MLLVRPPVSIFQQIILPYLSTAARFGPPGRASSTPANANQTYRPGPSRERRLFGTSNPARRPPETSGETSFGRPAAWEPYEVQGGSSRRRTREYLGLGVEAEDGRRGGDEDDPYMRTTALALDRIIRSHLPTASLNDEGKGKEVDHPTEVELASRIALSDSASKVHGRNTLTHHIIDQGVAKSKSKAKESVLPETPPSNRLSQPPEPSDWPFPPLIHQLLHARQFRLTTLHILNYPTHALDQALVARVAAYMDRHGGQAAARRLRKGKIPSPQDCRVMSQDGQDSFPPLTLPFQTQSLDGVIPGMMDALSPQARLTAFYNTQLAQQLSSSQHAKGFRPPKSFPLPNTSLRQLRALLSRIHSLEQSQNFVPDRVTANIVLSCWMRSALASPPDGVRVVQTRDKRWTTSPRHAGRNQDRFGTEEMGRLFSLVSRLFDRSAAPLTPTASAQMLGNETTSGQDVNPEVAEALNRDGGDPDLSYSRHVKPFVKIFQHGFKRRDDRAGLDKLREWDARIRLALSERKAGRDCRE